MIDFVLVVPKSDTEKERWGVSERYALAENRSLVMAIMFAYVPNLFNFITFFFYLIFSFCLFDKFAFYCELTKHVLLLKPPIGWRACDASQHREQKQCPDDINTDVTIIIRHHLSIFHFTMLATPFANSQNVNYESLPNWVANEIRWTHFWNNIVSYWPVSILRANHYKVLMQPKSW